ncbi:MAG: ABC transporter substrate-binding protein [Spirochaetales bacterium]|uniref:ABC transporter substrate-binding protein n=1 Tax=Candidatus Thalassospirochaeta sargassi TaxID=3119039 RepID=A0AAJ1IC95_9SPIO|nr:ABC transporter substrate-binding protein [Spirochaetales bacterium]
MKTLKIIAAFLLFLLPLNIFAGGQQEVPESVDAAGGTEAVEELRVVSLAPNITEVIFALGKGDALVGRTDWCNYPPEASDVATVGSIQQPSIEAIIELEPDIIIASTHAPKDIADQLTASGLDVRYYYGPEEFEGVYEVIRLVGADLGAEAEAEALVADMSSRYEAIRKLSENYTDKPSVYYAIGFGEGGDWTAGGDTFIGQMLEVAGGENIAADISGWSYSLEKLVEKQPDIIIVGQALKDLFIGSPFYSELEAVKNGRVYGINEDTISRQGPRLIEGIEQLNAIFQEK